MSENLNRVTTSKNQSAPDVSEEATDAKNDLSNPGSKETKENGEKGSSDSSANAGECGPEGTHINNIQPREANRVDLTEAGTGRFVDEALKRQRDRQRLAFRTLIDDKAQLEVRLRTLTQQHEATDKKKKQLEAALSAERSRAMLLTEGVTKLRANMENRKNGYRDTNDLSNLAVEEQNAVLGQKVNDLQLRLKRMV